MNHKTKHPEQVLVVVDVQPGFDTAGYEPMQRAAIRAIKHARKHNYTILFLEFDGYGRTYPRLLAASGRQQKNRLNKGRDGGGYVIHPWLEDHHITPAVIRVCGINRNACVADTVSDLSELYKHARIEIIEDAVHSNRESTNWGILNEHWPANVAKVKAAA